MKKSDRNVVAIGLALLIALTVLFLLRVFGVGIPWIWVFSPAWIPLVILLVWIEIGILRTMIYGERYNRRR